MVVERPEGRVWHIEMNTSFITLENSQVRLGPGVCWGNGKKGTTKQQYKKGCVSLCIILCDGQDGAGHIRSPLH